MEFRHFFKDRTVPCYQIIDIIKNSTKYFHQNKIAMINYQGITKWDFIIYDSDKISGWICAITLISHYESDTSQQFSISYESNYNNKKEIEIYNLIHSFIIEEIQKLGIKIK